MDENMTKNTSVGGHLFHDLFLYNRCNGTIFFSYVHGNKIHILAASSQTCKFRVSANCAFR
jgi:hypothetical protein